MYCMLNTIFNYIYEQRNLRFPTRHDHWLFQVGYHIEVSADARLTVHTDSGYTDNKYCFNIVLSWIFNFVVVLILGLDFQLERCLVGLS